MEISRQLLFFLSALGAFNGLLLAGYLFFVKPSTSANKWLAGLLLAISVRIGKSVWLYFSSSISLHVLQFGLSACLLIGPLLYCYILSLLEPNKAHKIILGHMWFWGAVLLGAAIGLRYEDYPELWRGSIFRFINYVWLVYILASFYRGRALLQRLLVKGKSYEQLLATSALIGVAIIWLAYYTSSYTSYITGALSFSFIVYLTVVLLFQRKQLPAVKYVDKKIEEQQAQLLQQRLESVMEKQELFTDPRLNLNLLASSMQISGAQLSQFLNDNLGQSFASFINQYRIKYATQQLIEQPNITMEVLAEQAGYNSQSTFYKAFKQIHSCTPAQYRKQHS